MSVLRRKKLMATCCGTVLLIVFLQHYTNTKTTWKNTVLMKLRKYQIELQQTIDFTHFDSTLKNVTSSDSNRKQRREPAEILQNDLKTMVDVNEMFKLSRDCFKRTRHQIAVYLHKSYESEFSKEFVYKETRNPIQEPKCEPGLDLIIVLTTRPGAFYNRVAIRNSWGRSDSEINRHIFQGSLFTYKTIFTVGRDTNNKIEKLIEDENDHFKDILRLDYQDTYENLPNKTILTLDWIAKNCQPKYALKTDDDCFVNIVALSSWLQKLKSPVDYVGKKNEFMPVIRDPLHRNYVPFEDLKEEFYNPYCAGGGYMIRGGILKNITEKSKEIKQIINEDAYVGMVTHALNITPVDDERFLPFIFTKKSVNKRFMCDWKGKFLMHGVKPDKQLYMHWNTLAMSNYPSLCDGEMS